MVNRQVTPSPKDILIVDDTPDNLRVLSQMLVRNGYKVRPVTSGSRALLAAQATPPDLILLDIRMPDISGYEICERLRADPKTRDVPIIFISALSDIKDKVRAFEVGGMDYVTKPFQLEEVLARIETHLTLRDLQRQLQEANARFEQELALAGQIQASFLPRELPSLPGWAFSVTLKPARETSGDFYDVNVLLNERVGILMADVVDKGAGAALYMALSCTLMRTYAMEYPTHPELILSATNRRILAEAAIDRFVTVFYGILDPASGVLVYCNAGHNPPYVFRAREGDGPQRLIRTGMPLGIFVDAAWTQGQVTLAPGDVLVLYTDGITDAQNAQGTFYDEVRLQRVVQDNVGRSAQEIQEAILADVTAFMGDEPQQDDMALVVVVREA